MREEGGGGVPGWDTQPTNLNPDPPPTYLAAAATTLTDLHLPIHSLITSHRRVRGHRNWVRHTHVSRLPVLSDCDELSKNVFQRQQQHNTVCSKCATEQVHKGYKNKKEMKNASSPRSLWDLLWLREADVIFDPKKTSRMDDKPIVYLNLYQTETVLVWIW